VTAATDERFLWYSSTGWVMWNLALSALLRGTTVCLYDGHPSFPVRRCVVALRRRREGHLRRCRRRLLRRLPEGRRSRPKRLGLERVRALGSTGSPLSPECYDWGWQQVKPDLWWAVISGGTDFASAFLGGTPELPTVPGEMQARCLGVDVEAWDEQGRPLVDAVGELVCKQPMPSMPLCFWNDVDGRRYRDSYFDTYPNVWRHGDWLRITPSGGAVVYGRSDATLNRHGHRLGTAEMYRVVEALPAGAGQPGDRHRIPGPAELHAAVRGAAAGADAGRGPARADPRGHPQRLSPRFLPDAIEQVAEVPRTLTGKKQELPVKKLMLGQALAEVVNPDACANPAAFAWFGEYAQRHGGAA
jgi:acetoacetyl-CoA synthetase